MSALHGAPGDPKLPYGAVLYTGNRFYNPGISLATDVWKGYNPPVLNPNHLLRGKIGMKIARFRAGRRVAFGVVRDDEITEIRGSIFTRFRLTVNRLPLSGVTLLPPTEPSGIWGPGLNSANHSAPGALSGEGPGKNGPRRPEPWHKGRNSLTGHGDPIIIPRDSVGEVHCLGEAVAVIGRNCRRVSPADARGYILGYACGNDVCDQIWQKEDTTMWRAKGSDTFAPVGPWIETDINPQELDLIVRLNGEEVQRVSTRDMYFTFAEIVSCMSQQVTLRPGDLVFSGTSAVTNAIKPGDLVEVEIPGIGVLNNPVAAEYDASSP